MDSGIETDNSMKAVVRKGSVLKRAYTKSKNFRPCLSWFMDATYGIKANLLVQKSIHEDFAFAATLKLKLALKRITVTSDASNHKYKNGDVVPLYADKAANGPDVVGKCSDAWLQAASAIYV
ncbi:hypothetical protein L6452_40215 [Arctium lappa]|uniref:Uncharacterized protein n=1 Tax=Arctium lappa TaxID=4217 RepID=A0ACB8XLV7_ARCLA|nr:hypothetical protein L6452_40215 [Arctium lappa]